MSPENAPEILMLRSLSWSPAGEHIALLAFLEEESGPASRILIVPAQGGPYRTLDLPTDTVGAVCWTHDGSGVLVTAVPVPTRT